MSEDSNKGKGKEDSDRWERGKQNDCDLGMIIHLNAAFRLLTTSKIHSAILQDIYLEPPGT